MHPCEKSKATVQAFEGIEYAVDPDPGETV